MLYLSFTAGNFDEGCSEISKGTDPGFRNPNAGRNLQTGKCLKVLYRVGGLMLRFVTCYVYDDW